MKVVIFCGGLGIRLREHSEAIPKPMVPIGYRPVLWHVMRYYAHFGHTEFILCLGYRADAIKEYFLRYNEALSNDFVLSGDGEVRLLSSDIRDWKITFVETGLRANIGQRLRAVRPLIGDDEMFLANYGDVVTDAPLDRFVAEFAASDKAGAFLSVRPTSFSFHVVRSSGDRSVTAVEDVEAADIWINGGYFMFRPEVFDCLGPGEELVEEPFQRMIDANRLMTFKYDGFWAPMDTLKDVQSLQAMVESGRPPWMLWQPRDPG